jgi:hypothetical protein
MRGVVVDRAGGPFGGDKSIRSRSITEDHKRQRHGVARHEWPGFAAPLARRLRTDADSPAGSRSGDQEIDES